jgi:signal transduction histidine kinase
VAASSEPAGLTVRVEDDGRGFEPAPTPKPDTFGLAGMRERAALIGGTLRIAPRRGGGSTVELRVPASRLTETHP